ncbi:MAG: hypothetical protein ABWZ88_16110 [Variovorax sp.]
MESMLQIRLRCPKCRASVLAEDVLTLSAKLEVTVCERCGARSIATFNERMVLVTVASGVAGWVLGLAVAYGAGLAEHAMAVASVVGAIAAGYASWRFAFRLSELH